MLSLAAFRYRNVLSEDGGPIATIETAGCTLGGRRLVQANATLKRGLVPKRPLEIYSMADGTGTHASAMVARHIAISEALERWAFHATVKSDRRSQYGFHIDASSSGMAAFPGLSSVGARRSARFEAFERHCLLLWWEGLLDGTERETPWPGVSAVVFEPEADVVAVILHARAADGTFHYGHAAAADFSEACRKAFIELSRNEAVLTRWSASAFGRPPSDILERRAWYFSTAEGHQRFIERLGRKARGRPMRELIADSQIEGPWNSYATVWRYAFRPISDRFVTNEADYFYW